MSRNKIYAIVEGQGEANRHSGGQPAIVVLLGRLLHDLRCWTLYPAEKYPPFRMSYSSFFTNDKFERAIRYHESYSDCAGVLVLLDMDDDCAKEKGFSLAQRVLEMGALPFSVVVVCATKEYEAWFLASLESIHDGEVFGRNPETVRDAKGWLRKKFGYKQTADQALYTRKIDFHLARLRSRSFRRLNHALEQMAAATEEGQQIVSPMNRDSDY